MRKINKHMTIRPRMKKLHALFLPVLLFTGYATPSHAGVDCFIGEIMAFGGNFTPRNWAKLDGQILPINSNQALFSILGTTYGGDGRTTFALPDMRGRVALGPRFVPGLTERDLGERGGVQSQALNVDQIPSHSHSVHASTALPADPGTGTDPGGRSLAQPASAEIYAPVDDASTEVAMSSAAIANAGNGVGHENQQPTLATNYIICLQGTYPSRN